MPGLQHSTSVPFSLEMLEADFVPFNLNSTAGQQVRRGIIVNDWGVPSATAFTSTTRQI